MRDQNVEVRYYSVIYEAIDDIRAALTGMLAPEVKEQIVGLAEVREVFRSQQVRHRGGLPGRGRLRAPQQADPRAARQRRDLPGRARVAASASRTTPSEVRAGTECGIGVKGYNDVKVRRPDRVLRARRGRTPARHMRRVRCRASIRGPGVSRSSSSALLAELVRREVKDPRVGLHHDHLRAKCRAT